MSKLNLLPPFTFDVLCYLNRDQLERFSIVCRFLKNVIERYFHSKPYRVFDYLEIHGGSYTLHINNVQWHPNRDDYTVQQFLAGQECNTCNRYYSFAEMSPYFCQRVRINRTIIYVAGDSTYNLEQVAEIESIAYLWRDGNLDIENAWRCDRRIKAKHFLPILNSPTILRCKNLFMDNAYFSFKDYKVLYTVNIIELRYYCFDDEIDPNYWSEFLEQPGVKPVLVFRYVRRENVDNLISRLFQAFLSAVPSSGFKIVFIQDSQQDKEPLTEFQETNKSLDEILKLKKALPSEFGEDIEEKGQEDYYTLERSSI